MRIRSRLIIALLTTIFALGGCVYYPGPAPYGQAGYYEPPSYYGAPAYYGPSIGFFDGGYGDHWHGGDHEHWGRR